MVAYRSTWARQHREYCMRRRSLPLWGWRSSPRASLRAGRDLVVDLYTAAVAAATGRDTIPQADWDRVRVYLPRPQKAKVIRERAFERTEAVKPRRIYAEELAARRGELVMLFRQ